MAPRDSRSVNCYGHGHLICKFTINVTVPRELFHHVRALDVAGTTHGERRDCPARIPLAGGVGSPSVFPSSAGYGAPEWAYLAFVKAYNEYIILSHQIV